MKRGEVWTASGGPDYAGTPRPVVIVQDDAFQTASVAVCALTTFPVDAPMVRLPVDPTPGNGLRQASWIMVDKVATMPRSKMGSLVGRLEQDAMERLDDALMVFVGLARPSQVNP